MSDLTPEAKQVLIAEYFGRLSTLEDSIKEQADPIELRWARLAFPAHREYIQDYVNRGYESLLVRHMEALSKTTDVLSRHRYFLALGDPNHGYLDVLERHPRCARRLIDVNLFNSDQSKDIYLERVFAGYGDPDFVTDLLQHCKTSPIQVFNMACCYKASELLPHLASKDTTYHAVIVAAIATRGHVSTVEKAKAKAGAVCVDQAREFLIKHNPRNDDALNLALATLEKCSPVISQAWDSHLTQKATLTPAQALRASARILKVHHEQSQELTPDVQQVVAGLITQAVDATPATPGRDILLYHALVGKNKPLYKYLLEKGCKPNFTYPNKGSVLSLAQTILWKSVADEDLDWLTMATDHGLKDTTKPLWQEAVLNLLNKNLATPKLGLYLSTVDKISPFPNIETVAAYTNDITRRCSFSPVRETKLMAALAPILAQHRQPLTPPVIEDALEISDLDLV